MSDKMSKILIYNKILHRLPFKNQKLLYYNIYISIYIYLSTFNNMRLKIWGSWS